MRFRNAAPTVLALAVGCGRSCGGSTNPATEASTEPAPPSPGVTARERCRRELAHAAVAVAPGTGAIDTLLPACGPGDALTVFVVRGHTLARLLRSREPGAVFSPPEVVSTGVDRLGPAGQDDALGPLAWRSPTSAVDGLDRDAWWAAWIEPGGRVARGTTLLAEGDVGLGVIAPLARLDGGAGVEALATVAREGANPSLARAVVATRFDEAVEGEGDDGDAGGLEPRVLGEGELEAYEPAQRVALALAVTAQGATELRATALDAHGDVYERGRVPIASDRVLVVARGVARGDAALFAYSTFEPVRPGADAGGPPCIEVGPGLCVRAGPPTLLVVAPQGVRTVALARSGLVDTLALDAQDRAVVLYLAPDGPSQRATRVDVERGRTEALELRPTDALPPLDHPALVRCGGEPWLAAEVLLEAGDGGGPSGGSRESAVLAVPLGCVLSTPAR